jgi:hypothetical protein
MFKGFLKLFRLLFVVGMRGNPIYLAFFLCLVSTSFSVNAAFMSAETLIKASKASKSDDVGYGWCGRGVWSVLKNIGYGAGIRSGDGQDWECILRNAGWVPLHCPLPKYAPFGSVLVYTSDLRLHGRNLVGTKGGRFGHVELVALDEKLGRVYVSDKPRRNAGGTVPMNFTKRAWVPPGFVMPSGSIQLKPSSYDPIKVVTASRELMNERLLLAKALFNS